MKIIENNLIVDINKVVPNDYNPKLNYEDIPEFQAQYEKIKESLRYHGQIDPVLIREIENGLYEIINGFHRWKAMKELKFEKVEIKNLGKISRQEAIKKALSTEEPRIPLDVIETAKLLKEIKESEAGLEGLPYLEQEIKEKIELLEFDWNTFENEEDIEKMPDTQKFNIIVTTEQKEIIDKAMKQVMDNEGCKEGRALELICIEFINSPRGTTGLDS